MSDKERFNPDSYPSALGLPDVRRSKIAPVFISVGLFIIGALLVSAVAIQEDNLSRLKLPALLPVEAMKTLSLPEPPEAEGIPPVAVLPVAGRAAVNSDGFCNGYETFCSTTTTDKPAETLQKLAAAMPQGNDRHYRVVVSVVAESPAKE